MRAPRLSLPQWRPDMSQITALGLSPLMALALAGLALLVGVAGVLAIAAFFSSGPAPSPDAAEWRAPAYNSGERRPPKPPSADAQTLARPIFVKSRRPPAAASKDQPRAEASPAAPVAMLPPGTAVRAISKGDGARRAFLVSSGKPAGVWVKVGDEFEGFRVRTIDRARLVLEGEKKIALDLFPRARGSEDPAQPAMPGYPGALQMPPPGIPMPGPPPRQTIPE